MADTAIIMLDGWAVGSDVEEFRAWQQAGVNC